MLPISGPLKMSQVNLELNQQSNTQISLGSSSVRSLYNVINGPIRMAADGYGKALANYDIAYGYLYQPFDYLNWSGKGDTCWSWYDTGPQYGLGDIQATHPSWDSLNLNPFVTDLCSGDIRSQTQWSKLVKIELIQSSSVAYTIFKEQIPAATYSSVLGQYGFILPYPNDISSYTDFNGATKWYFSQ